MFWNERRQHGSLSANRSTLYTWMVCPCSQKMALSGPPMQIKLVSAPSFECLFSTNHSSSAARALETCSSSGLSGNRGKVNWGSSRLAAKRLVKTGIALTEPSLSGTWAISCVLFCMVFYVILHYSEWLVPAKGGLTGCSFAQGKRGSKGESRRCKLRIQITQSPTSWLFIIKGTLRVAIIGICKTYHKH